MKTMHDVLNYIDAQIDSLEFCIAESKEETKLKHQREGAKAALETLKRFIEDSRWKP